jgi:hypothetical protein
MSTKKKSSPESIVRQIKRKTRRKYSAEEKIRIVLVKHPLKKYAVVNRRILIH